MYSPVLFIECLYFFLQEKDCEKIAQLVDKKIEDDNQAKSYNLRASGKGNLILFSNHIVELFFKLFDLFLLRMFIHTVWTGYTFDVDHQFYGFQCFSRTARFHFGY